ncbi:hypothetical protein IMZ11_03915 [Microtetraspora sp. AC03309]|uniref:hypothetical protein n=1 Tax=Microtetraspora sp. AC03309 TaxID=2779376 RepID=UPI001E2E3866|nr:hypothetical protein [Microtetraspora sp. AC03309]MCC5574782.1 hypothetical protein [Microtetraspora sp. AC03309]
MNTRSAEEISHAVHLAAEAEAWPPPINTTQTWSFVYPQTILRFGVTHDIDRGVRRPVPEVLEGD